jgi:L-rhamnose-H+ transport protein
MGHDLFEALALILTAAVMNASYTLPMKLNRKWRWEHSWLAFSVLGVAVVPTIIATITVPGLWSIYRQVPASTLLEMALFGAGWGVSLVFFGLSIPLVGVAIAFTISLSTSAASGALLPLIGQHSDRLFTVQGGMLVIGILLIAIGVAFCGKAGRLRDEAKAGAEERRKSGFTRGFLYALISGVLGSLLNLGLAYGNGIQEEARLRGASNTMTSNAVWLPCVYAGFIPGVIYCLYLMKKNASVAGIRTQAAWYYWIMAACMGLLWYGSILLYSLSTSRLGELGPSIGWPLFLSSIVLVSTSIGVLTGEWSPSLRGPFRTLLIGLLLLLSAIGILSEAGRMAA